MKKKSISELIHFFVRHPLQNSLQMKFWRWLVSPADAEDKEEAIQEEWMNIIAEPDEATRRSWYEVRRKAGLANPIIKPHWEIKPLLRIASMILIPLFSVYGCCFLCSGTFPLVHGQRTRFLLRILVCQPQYR